MIRKVDKKDLKSTVHARYLRIPPWSKIICRTCAPRDGDYIVHVKVKEHKKKGALKVYGLLFECDHELTVGSHVDIEIILSEDSERFRGYGQIIEVQRLCEGGPFRTKVDFRAASDEETQMIARLAGKFC